MHLVNLCNGWIEGPCEMCGEKMLFRNGELTVAFVNGEPKLSCVKCQKLGDMKMRVGRSLPWDDEASPYDALPWYLRNSDGTVTPIEGDIDIQPEDEE